MSESDTELVVVKVGGSLYDLPDLGPRLRCWLDRLETQRVILVPGGGVTTDAVRTLDRWQRLGEEASHWLALQTLSLNANFLARILPRSMIAQDVGSCYAAWQENSSAVLDCRAFVTYCRTFFSLPHTWDVTSDSIAARVAHVFGATRLILLKSVPLPAGIDWAEAGQRGLVDAYFGEVVGRGTTQVQWVHFRP